MRQATALAVLLLLTAGIAIPAEARRGARTWNSPPVKDCTRINGRMGYYANPWCTPAEQARWDRWDSRRTQRK